MNETRTGDGGAGPGPVDHGSATALTTQTASLDAGAASTGPGGLKDVPISDLLLEMARRFSLPGGEHVPPPPDSGKPPWWHAHPLLDKRMQNLRVAMEHVIREAEALARQYPPLNSMHEALGVLGEEGFEFLLEVWRNDKVRAKREAKQIAAVCLRIMAEVEFK